MQRIKLPGFALLRIVTDTELEDAIAEVYGGTTSKANARLIAAAPEMLAALKVIVNMDGYREDIFDARRVAALAIARAEGRV